MIRKLTTIIAISFVTINAIFLAGVTLLANNMFFDFTSKEISQSRLELLNESNEKASSFISSVKEAGTYIAADRTVREKFSGTISGPYDAIVEQREMIEIINAVVSLNSEIYSIEFYTDRYDQFPVIPSKVIYPLDTLEKQPWMNMIEKMDNGWVPSHPSIKDGSEVIGFIQRLSGGPKGTTIGYLKVDVLAENFFEYMRMEELFNGENESLLLLNTGGNIIAQKSYPEYREILDKITIASPQEPFNRLIDKYGEKSNYYQVLKYNHDVYLLLISERNYDQWRMVYLVPADALTKETKKLGLIVVFIGLCGLGASIPIAFLLGRKLMKPIGNLIEGMKKVEQGNFDVELGPYYIEEYDILSKNFNHMALELSESLDNLKKEMYYRKEAEIKMLQAQINPHFLYNTLDMIHWKSMDCQAEDLSLMVYQLSKMLRISLSSGRTFITLRDELEHVKCYINIQMARLNKDILFSLHVPAVLKDCYVPKIILQPFIENSIRHGYPEEGGRSVKLNVTAKSVKIQRYEVLEIRITDFGTGVPEEWDVSNVQGIGIKNVKERIRLYCGDEYGLNLINHEEGGVTVKIILPLIKNGDELKAWLEDKQ